jgi:hypothetical protein
MEIILHQLGSNSHPEGFASFLRRVGKDG